MLAPSFGPIFRCNLPVIIRIFRLVLTSCWDRAITACAWARASDGSVE